MPRLVCIKCHCLFKIEKNGISAVEMVRDKPYEMYDADKWKCPKCGMEILAGFGEGPWVLAHEFAKPNIIEFIKNALAEKKLVVYKDVLSASEREAAKELTEEYGIDFLGDDK